MKERNITISLEKAVEWYNSGNDSLKEVALQAFSRDELLYNYRNIKSLSDACEVLGFDYVGIITTASMPSSATSKFEPLPTVMKRTPH